MTAYTLFGQSGVTAGASGAGNAGTLGLHFTVSTACTLVGLWHYSPAGWSQTQLPTTIALYVTQSSPATGTLVTSNAATWLTGPGGSAASAGSGWVYAAFTSPPSLSSGVDYMAAQFRNDGTNGWFVIDQPFSWPVSSGVLTAPDDAGSGQGWFVIGSTLAFPSGQLAGYNWGIDVQVSTAASPSFPLAPLDLCCEIDAGGWQDVSSYVYQREGTSPPVTVTRGRPDETQQAVPGKAAWQWNNRDGRFSPKNPLGPYYGQLQRNTPVRFSVPATSNYLRLEADNSDRAFVATNSTISVTGSLEMRIALRLTDWQGCVLAERYDNTQPSWYWLLNADGTLTFAWFDSGGTQHTLSSDAALPYSSGDFALKVTLDATTSTVTFYTAAAIGGTYAQLGDSETLSASTSVRAGNASLVIGWSNNLASPQMFGRVYEYRLYSGIAGTVAADGIFSAQAAGATSWADSAGNTWNVSGGGEISSRDYRYHGLMSSQPPKWDVTGNDQCVNAQAGGPLRIMSQGTAPPVQSPMRRAILAQTGSLVPVAYWPMEDGATSTQFGPAVGPNPMTAAGGPPVPATSSAFACSSPLPTLGGAALQGQVRAYTGTGTWTVRFLAEVGSLPASGEVLMQVNCTGGLAAYVTFVVNSSGTVALTAYDANLNVVAGTGNVAWTGGIQTPLWWSIEATPSGSDVEYALVSLAPGAASALSASATSSSPGSAGAVTVAAPNIGFSFPDTVMGHLQVQSAWVSLFSLAGPLQAHLGEAAAVRYARLATENGWPVRIKGSPAYSARMGAQGIDTLSSLLQECETADLGQQLEPRECAGLGYRTLASMTAQSPVLALGYTASQPGGVNGSGGDSGLDPTYDDLLARNDWTLTRGSSTGTQGGTYRAYLADGSAMSVTGTVGDYGDSQTVNVETDAQLPDTAWWMVHAGTADELRWPSVPVNLARTEMSALQAAAMQLDAGDMLEVTSLPDTVLYDPAREVALGFTEKLGGKFWSMEYQCVPGSPYDVVLLGDPVYGRLDTDGSSLASGATSAATSLSVATAGTYPVWTTSAGDFPFDIAVGGERMTVTNIAGSSSPQAFTVTRSVNGVVKAQASGADVRLWFPPIVGPW